MSRRRAADEPPGLPAKYTWVVYLVPACILAMYVIAHVVDLPEWAIPLGGIGIPAVVILFIAARVENRRRRARGLVPAREGYSAKVELLAAQLREHAKELEAAQTFGDEVPLPFTLQSYLDEVRRTASEADHHQFLPKLKLTRSLMDEADVRHQVETIRAAADECDRYAADVKRRGGVYKSSRGQLAGCSVMLIATAAGGIWMIRSEDYRPWGIGVVMAAAVLTFALAGSQRDPA